VQIRNNPPQKLSDPEANQCGSRCKRLGCWKGFDNFTKRMCGTHSLSLVHLVIVRLHLLPTQTLEGQSGRNQRTYYFQTLVKAQDTGTTPKKTKGKLKFFFLNVYKKFSEKNVVEYIFLENSGTGMLKRIREPE
jgi:hypothetical protein